MLVVGNYFRKCNCLWGSVIYVDVDCYLLIGRVDGFGYKVRFIWCLFGLFVCCFVSIGDCSDIDFVDKF